MVTGDICKLLQKEFRFGKYERRWTTTIFRRLAVTVSRAVTHGRSGDIALLMCHSTKTADTIYNAENFDARIVKASHIIKKIFQCRTLTEEQQQPLEETEMRFDFKAIKGEVKGQVKGEVKGEVNVSTETSEMTLYDNDDPEVGTRRSNKKDCFFRKKIEKENRKAKEEK